MIEVEALRGHVFPDPYFSELWAAAEALTSAVSAGSQVDEVEALVDRLDRADHVAQSIIHRHFIDIDHMYGE